MAPTKIKQGSLPAKRSSAGDADPGVPAKRPTLGGGSSAVREPPEPMRPLDKDMNGHPAVAEKAANYFRGLIAFASHAVQKQLAKVEVQGGLGLQAPLNELQPIRIEDMGLASSLTSFREAWNNKNCLKALIQTGMYEASANIWWVSLRTTWFDEVQFPDGGSALGDVTATPWPQFAAARALWCDEAFNRSAENPMLRRFTFPAYLPSAVQGLAAAKMNIKRGTAIFAELPIFAGLIEFL